MSTPAISVIIPHFQDLERLDRCLAALGKQTVPPDTYEIVVADNMSACGEAAVRAVIGGRARLVIASQKGAGPARNAAIAVAHGDIFAFTDADCVPADGWLRAGVEALNRVDVVGGCMTLLFEGGAKKSGAEGYEAVFAFDNRGYVERKGFSVTANLFCRRAVFDATGPFHAGLSEDRDWCHRATALGYCLGYAPAAVVAHPARADWLALLTKWRRLNAELFANVRSQPGGRLRWCATMLAMPVSIVAHLPRVLGSPKLKDRGERVRAAVTLTRLRLWRCVDGIRLAVGVHG